MKEDEITEQVALECKKYPTDRMEIMRESTYINGRKVKIKDEWRPLFKNKLRVTVRVSILLRL